MNKLAAAGLFAALALQGCASDEARAAREANPAPCPNTLILNDAARIVQFEGEETLENVTFTGEMVDVSMSCRYFTDNPIDAEISIDFAFGRGPKAPAAETTFTYFVAVTRTDLEVIAKEEFQIPVRFSGDRMVVTDRVEIDEIVIPRAGENVSGTNFEVIVGFSLTPAQAIFNRSGKSLKFPDLQ